MAESLTSPSWCKTAQASRGWGRLSRSAMRTLGFQITSCPLHPPTPPPIRQAPGKGVRSAFLGLVGTYVSQYDFLQSALHPWVISRLLCALSSGKTAPHPILFLPFLKPESSPESDPQKVLSEVSLINPGWCSSVDWVRVVNQRVVGLIPSQGTRLGCGPGQVPSSEFTRGKHSLMFLSLSFSLPSPLSKKQSRQTLPLPPFRGPP